IDATHSSEGTCGLAGDCLTVRACALRSCSAFSLCASGFRLHLVDRLLQRDGGRTNSESIATRIPTVQSVVARSRDRKRPIENR
ncbi:hypothetical protein CSUI_005376, partial [Cystoisospora suis]